MEVVGTDAKCRATSFSVFKRKWHDWVTMAINDEALFVYRFVFEPLDIY